MLNTSVFGMFKKNTNFNTEFRNTESAKKPTINDLLSSLEFILLKMTI